MPLQVEDVKQVYQSIRSDVDTSFSVIYNHALRVAEAVGTDPVMPRLGGRQQHRSNVPAVSVLEYYQRNLAIPLLDTVITELDSRFAGNICNVATTTVVCKEGVCFFLDLSSLFDFMHFTTATISLILKVWNTN